MLATSPLINFFVNANNVFLKVFLSSLLKVEPILFLNLFSKSNVNSAITISKA